MKEKLPLSASLFHYIKNNSKPNIIFYRFGHYLLVTIINLLSFISQATIQYIFIILNHNIRNIYQFLHDTIYYQSSLQPSIFLLIIFI